MNENELAVRLSQQDALDIIYYLKSYTGETQNRTSPLDLADKIRGVLVASA